MAKKEPLYPHVPKGKMSQVQLVEAEVGAQVQLVEAEVGAPLWRYIKGKRYKLAGMEKKQNIAESWASNMREHGEIITVIPTAIGYAVYRQE